MHIVYKVLGVLKIFKISIKILIETAFAFINGWNFIRHILFKQVKVILTFFFLFIRKVIETCQPLTMLTYSNLFQG